MITMEMCKELLESQEEIERVEVSKDEYVRGRFANPLDPKEPHDLVVHPITEKLVLRVLVPNITKLRSGNSNLFRVLQDLNYRMLIGKVGTDARDGEVMVEINHPCQDGQMEDPPPDVFARIVRAAMSTARNVQLMAAQVAMVESGVPSEVAKQFMTRFQEGEDDGEGQDML